MGKLTLFLHDVHGFDAFFDVEIHLSSANHFKSDHKWALCKAYSALKTSKTDKKVTKKWKK